MWALADPELNGYVGSAGTVGEAWPHLQQVCRLERQRVVKGKKQVAVSYAISSLPATDADARRLLSLSRGHWGIENRLHWVRDVTFDEDRSQVRTGAAPQVLAGLRNLVISLVRRAGHSNVAAALRRHNAHLSEAFDMMGFTYQAGEAPHGEADLRAAAGRVWVRRPVHHRPGKRRRITTGSHRTTGEAPVLETQTYRQGTPPCVKEPAPRPGTGPSPD